MRNTTFSRTSSGPNLVSTVTYQSAFLINNPAFSYNEIPYSFQVGSFMIDMVNNDTDYETPPQNGSSTMFLGYVFAFNVTTPDNKTTNTYFNWWPPCNTNLGLPCERNNTWDLPDPENATINYGTTNLYILWYTIRLASMYPSKSGKGLKSQRR